MLSYLNKFPAKGIFPKPQPHCWPAPKLLWTELRVLHERRRRFRPRPEAAGCLRGGRGLGRWSPNRPGRSSRSTRPDRGWRSARCRRCCRSLGWGQCARGRRLGLSPRPLRPSEKNYLKFDYWLKIVQSFRT